MSARKKDDFDQEIALTRKNEDFMRLLDKRGREKATIPLAEARIRSGISARRRRPKKQG
jgi:hypothetical protein